MILKSVRLVLFYAFARHLPESTAPGGVLWRKIRFWICSPLFAECGSNVNIERGASIGRGTTISIGSNSGIGVKASIGGGARIGANVMMGPEVLILTANHARTSVDQPMLHQGNDTVQPVTVCDDVWIGARVIILPGVRVGNGSILGAGAVVTKDVPPYAVAAGNPARVVRYRTGAPPGLERNLSETDAPKALI